MRTLFHSPQPASPSAAMAAPYPTVPPIPMPTPQQPYDPQYMAGAYEEQGSIEALAEKANLVQSVSMDIVNDPRFFQDNVINYRLAAFSGLGVVSGLLVQNTMGAMFDMDKNMGIFFGHGFQLDLDSFVQLLSFLILCICFFFNMLGTYVGVAQPYHTIRLMTAGSAGFEISASYYLNKNIILWRHFAIKSMLISLPLFVAQMGLRLLVKFDRGNMKAPARPSSVPFWARTEGLLFAGMFIIIALFLLHVHIVHFTVFRERYSTMMSATAPPGFQNQMRSMMTPRTISQGPWKPANWFTLDV